MPHPTREALLLVRVQRGRILLAVAGGAPAAGTDDVAARMA
jgi:hypothetical protein